VPVTGQAGDLRGGAVGGAVITAASALAPAISRAIAVVIDSPGSAKVMLATVVMPPAKAASEPVQKSSTQTGSRGPTTSCTAARTAAHTRWT